MPASGMDENRATIPCGAPVRPMSLQEARSVIWLRNNPKLLGDLLDQGYLNKERLAWATQKAYDPKLKMAADVLLEWLSKASEATAGPAVTPRRPAPHASAALPQLTLLPSVEPGVSLEQARAVAWPFKPFKGQPIGELVDTEQLSLRDLAYAIENAWDERVRQAATDLRTVRLNQVVKEPQLPTGPLEVVSAGRSYSEARQYRWTTISGLLMGALLMLTAALFRGTWLIRSSASRPATPDAARAASGTAAFIIALLILLALMAVLSWLLKRRQARLSHTCRQANAWRLHLVPNAAQPTNLRL